ncbi:MAG: ribonuclease PH [Pseudomonadota bacterium]
MRPSGRTFDELRPVSIETGVSRHAEGSCLIKCGHTHVLCTASWEENVPPWLKGRGAGWVTAEYSMLPRATHTRGRRETKSGPSGRTQEIQRLIGRSLRAVVDFKTLGERQIMVDCDVIQADGCTRCASITGGFVALREAIKWALQDGMITKDPLTGSVAAISCGLYSGGPVVDLDYDEDSNAQADANFIMTGDGGLVEVQATAEGDPFSEEQFQALFSLARDGCRALTLKQNEV